MAAVDDYLNYTAWDRPEVPEVRKKVRANSCRFRSWHMQYTMYPDSDACKIVLVFYMQFPRLYTAILAFGTR